MNNKQTIYIASDHGGYHIKELLAKWLSEGHQVQNLGPDGLNPADDYPDYAFAVAQAVASDKESLGILVCRSGQGVCVVANKVAGIQAAQAWNEEMAKAGRQDDHINVLCLPADYMDLAEMQKIITAWLVTTPGDDERYVRRLQKIRAIEQE